MERARDTNLPEVTINDMHSIPTYPNIAHVMRLLARAPSTYRLSRNSHHTAGVAEAEAGVGAGQSTSR